MTDESVKLHRTASIPIELTNEDSHIGSMVDIARRVSASKSHASQVLAERARALILNACTSYIPNDASKAGVMCASGRDNGVPFRGSVCCNNGCIVSQIQEEAGAYKFVGKLRPVEDRLVETIFAEVKDDPQDSNKPEASDGKEDR